MGEGKCSIDFVSLCLQCKLGELISEPVRISGGLLHRMYAIETTKRKFAVKILNPNIMSRKSALGNYLTSERIARLAATKEWAVSAEVIKGEAVQNIEGHYFMFFKWVKGKPLKPAEIKTDHCEIMGEILASIHNIDFSEIGMVVDKVEVRHAIDWKFYYQNGKERSLPWVTELYSCLAELEKWQTRAIDAAVYLSTNKVISHRDLDPKNVLWHLEQPIVIDWEAAGYTHPAQDLIETAIYWAVTTEGGIDQQKFLAFIKSYQAENRAMDADWSRVLTNGFLGKFDWLEYNLKRSLWIECADVEEQEIGTQQVMETIKAIRRYAWEIPVLLRWLNDEILT